jgi:outer membrane protein assembly factor BamB
MAVKTASAIALVTSLFLAACSGSSVSTGVPPQAASASSVGGLRAAQSTRVGASGVDWDSFGFDLQRTGYNPNETVVGVDNVGTLQKLWSFNVGAKSMREPVLASGVMINGQATNVLYAGSSKGAILYALNADTGAIIWQYAAPATTFNCGAGATQFSIQATPAIDRANNRIYFGDGHNQVHALDLSLGTEDHGWPLSIAPYIGGHNNMHGGLTFNPANGMLYAVTSSICDYAPWYGRIVAINTATPAILGQFFPVSGTSKQGGIGGGIWGAGGASIDPVTNDVYVATGNADIRAGQMQNAGDAESVVMLSSDVNTVLAANYPTNLNLVNGYNDLDFGSTPMVFKPPGCPQMAVALNKAGMFELYDTATISSGPVQYIEMSIAQDNGEFQGVAAYDPVLNYVYVPLPSTFGIYKPGLAAFSIQSNCTLDPTPVWNAVFGPDGAVKQVKSARSPVTVANGVVYIANGLGDTQFAFNAATGAKLWHVPQTSEARGGTIVANGIVYVTADGGGGITAWAPAADILARRRAQSLRR